MITKPPSEAIVLGTWDIKVDKERIACFAQLIRMCGVLVGLASQLSERATKEYEPIIRYATRF